MNIFGNQTEIFNPLIFLIGTQHMFGSRPMQFMTAVSLKARVLTVCCLCVRCAQICFVYFQSKNMIKSS